MVSTWRYYSFKGIGLSKPYTPLLVILAAGFIYLIWNYAAARAADPGLPSTWPAAWSPASAGRIRRRIDRRARNAPRSATLG